MNVFNWIACLINYLIVCCFAVVVFVVVVCDVKRKTQRGNKQQNAVSENLQPRRIHNSQLAGHATRQLALVSRDGAKGKFSPFEGYTTTDCAVHNKRAANQPRPR